MHERSLSLSFSPVCVCPSYSVTLHFKSFNCYFIKEELNDVRKTFEEQVQEQSFMYKNAWPTV